MHSIVLLLLLTTYDYNTGLTLESKGMEMPYLFPGTEVEMCREEGVARAYVMTDAWRAKGYGNASTNIVCMIKVGGDSI